MVSVLAFNFDDPSLIPVKYSKGASNCTLDCGKVVHGPKSK